MDLRLVFLKRRTDSCDSSPSEADRQKQLGLFSTEIEAAKAYDEWAKSEYVCLLILTLRRNDHFNFKQRSWAEDYDRSGHRIDYRRGTRFKMQDRD